MLHICEQDWVCGSSSLNIGSGVRFTFALCAFERIKRKKEEKYDKPCFQISRKKSRNRAKIGFHSLLAAKMVILLFLLVLNNDCKDL